MDSLKKWRDPFFGIKSFVFLISVPWFNGDFVEKDPLPLRDEVDVFDDKDSRSTFLDSNDEEMGLFDFITTVDTFKVKIGERTLADEEIPLIQKTMVQVFLPSKQPFSLIRPYY
nr:hypothetical protein [Tanacetum cinerariifolium]